MNFYLNWYRNHERSKLNICILLSKFQSFNFEFSYFLYHLRQKFILYLILRLQSMVKWRQENSSMVAFLNCKTPGQKQVIYFINWVILIFMHTTVLPHSKILKRRARIGMSFFHVFLRPEKRFFFQIHFEKILITSILRNLV